MCLQHGAYSSSMISSCSFHCLSLDCANCTVPSDNICAAEQKQKPSHRLIQWSAVLCSVCFILPGASVCLSFFSQEILVTTWVLTCATDYSHMSFSVPSHCWERRVPLVRSQLGFGVRPAGKKIIHSLVCLLATVS